MEYTVGLSWGQLNPNSWVDPNPGGAVGVPTPTVPPTTVPTITGIDPTELANATYGKVIPISALGRARIGGSIIAGPYLNTIDNVQCGSFAISFGFPANPVGTRVLFEIAADSTVIWTSAAGTATISSGTFVGGSFTARFYPGTFTQAADPIEIELWGANAVAYRPQMIIWFDNFPLTNYSNKIPFVSALIGDTTDGADPSDGINLGEGFERFAYSPWVGLTTNNFETSGVTDIVDGIIQAQDQSFITFLRDHARVYRSWDILQTDKLRVTDRGSSIAPDIVLDRTTILSGSVTFSRQEPSSVAGELELITIDPDADFMMLPAIANRPREPYRVSGSRGRESVTLPIIINAATRQALVTYMKFAEEQARRRVTLVVTSYGLEIEPGDFVQLQDLADGIDADTFKVIETSHRGDYTVSIVLESVLRCKIGAYDAPGDVNWRGVAQTASNATTYNFTDATFGDPAADRRIIVGVFGSSDSARTVSSVSVGGISASLIRSVQSGVGTAEMWIATVPTGATGNIDVTWSGEQQRCAISIWSSRLNSASPLDSDGMNIDEVANGANATLITRNNGFVVGFGGHHNVLDSIVARNLTEKYEDTLNDGVINLTLIAADVVTTGSSTEVGFDLDNGGVANGNSPYVVASF